MKPIWLIEAGVQGTEAEPLLAEIRRQGMIAEVVPFQALQMKTVRIAGGRSLAEGDCVLGYGTFPFARRRGRAECRGSADATSISLTSMVDARGGRRYAGTDCRWLDIMHRSHKPGGGNMIRVLTALAIAFAISGPLAAQDVEAVAGKRVVFLGDSITQAGGYVTFITYYLEKLNPQKDFDLLGLGLASETLSGLSEDGHAGGKFPRPCLFERLGRLLEKARPDVVFACYGMNDGIYQPLDADRFTAFQKGVTRLIEQCRAAGVKQVYLITPPIYDLTPRGKEFDYDSVLTAYAKWETELKVPGVRVIDLHTPMRKARDARTEPFSRDRVHPGDDGHLLMARTILAALGVKLPDEAVADVKKDPLYKLVAEKRAMRSAHWMKHIGYTREAKVDPQPLGTVEADAAKLQEKIDALRRSRK